MPDTNIVIALFALDVSVQNEFSNADEIFLSCVVLGELCYGARKSARTTENLARIEAFATSNAVLPCDMDTSREYAILKEALRARGKMIPDNDIWIAATALQHGLTLATRDAHFNEVTGLLIANW